MFTRSRGTELGLIVLLAILILIEFVLAPVTETGYVSVIVADVLAGIALGAGAILVVRNMLLRWIVGVTVAAGIAVALLATAQEHSTYSLIVGLTSRFVVLGVLTGFMATAVFARDNVTENRVLGAIALYLQVVLLFASAYGVLGVFTPHAFAIAQGTHQFPGGPALYFSFSTMTTAGFGDIVPVSPLARTLVSLECVFGQLYPATVIARLITLGFNRPR
jgi:hypothetical protein